MKSLFHLTLSNGNYCFMVDFFFPISPIIILSIIAKVTVTKNQNICQG